MSAQTPAFVVQDARHPGVNGSEWQEQPTLIEVPQSVANADTISYAFPAAGDIALPPHDIAIYTHTGGDITNGANANWAQNAGDTLIFTIDTQGFSPTGANSGGSTYLQQMLKWPFQVQHSLASTVTNGAVTAAQLAASINADTTVPSQQSWVIGSPQTTGLGNWVFAVAGLTANRVTLFPKHPRVKVTAAGGTANGTILFSGTADWSLRTYANETLILTGGTGWAYSFAAGTRTLTLTNGTGGAKSRVAVLVRR